MMACFEVDDDGDDDVVCIVLINSEDHNTTTDNSNSNNNKNNNVIRYWAYFTDASPPYSSYSANIARKLISASYGLCILMDSAVSRPALGPTQTSIQ
jgi:hypothetical protein